VTVHEAERIPGPDGVVEWGAELTDEQAVQRRRQELDIVVRGPGQKATRPKARQIEDAVGTPVAEDAPHRGRMALPHFHQVSRSPDGHSFYETSRRRARKKKS
jgi:hypothetical protein